jgi:predicted transcriptional regulator
MALRTKLLECLERRPSDFFTLQKILGTRSDRLANELDNSLKAGYVTKSNTVFHLTDRGREYLKVERA